MNQTKVFLISILLLLTFNLYSWERKTHNFEPAIYNGGTQNWQIKESKEGWIYFANNEGLLEYDGYNWTLYPMNGKILRAIALEKDLIYAGGNNIFGFYAKNKNGILEFTPLSDKISKKWKGNIWDIYVIKDKIYYIDDHDIYIYNDKHEYKGTVTCDFKIDCTLINNDTIYFAGENQISYFDIVSNKVKETQYVDLASKTRSASFKIVEMLPYRNGAILITSNSGLYFAVNGTISKMKTAGDDFIQKNQLFQGAMRNEILEIGSVQSGLLILDLNDPDYYEVINQNNSLNNNTVLCSFFDRNKNLWIGLDNGIAFIDMDGTIDPLFSKESPIGTGYSAATYHGNVYLGTNQGLYILDKEDNLSTIPEAKGQIISLFTLHNTLFSCGDNNLYIIDKNQQYSINIPGFMGVYPIEGEDSLLLATTYFGLKLLGNKDGRWRILDNIKGVNFACKWGLTHYKGREYWQANPDDDYINKLIFDSDFKNVTVKHYNLGDNQVMNNSYINIIDSNPVICTNQGLLRYDEPKDGFIPYPELENLLEGNRAYEYLFMDRNRDIWYKINGALYFLPYSNNRVDLLKYYIGLESQMVSGSEYILTLDSAHAVVGTYKGFSLINTKVVQNQKKNFGINIRWIKTLKDGVTTSYSETDQLIKLVYGNSTVSFAWGGPDLATQGEIYFSYRLVGLDSEWSTPTQSHLKEYTNLKEGKYTFEVKASILDQNQELVSYDKISFEILPPWYRSVWAYCFYFVLILVSLILIYRYTIRKQKKEIKLQQQQIEYQKLVLKEERREKDQKIHELEKEKLEADLQYKTYETTGYILNISRKNELFEKIKKESSTLLKLIDTKGSIAIIRKKISDLIQDINLNVKHDDDFDSFKSNFDIVHKDFFKILEQRYPQLTQKEKTLCAYIKMNFVSKEIAPLLNISVRGVEINRYNLRKKMGLDRNINLSEYLNGLSPNQENNPLAENGE